MSIVLYKCIKIRRFDCSFGVGTKFCCLLTYILAAQFQLENWNAPARLDSARDPFSPARLTSGNFSLNTKLYTSPKTYFVETISLYCIEIKRHRWYTYDLERISWWEEKVWNPSLNTQSCIMRPLCSTFKFENLRSPK